MLRRTVQLAICAQLFLSVAVLHPRDTDPNATSGEHRSASDSVGSATITRDGVVEQNVRYVDLEGQAIFEGDIVLGSVAEVSTAEMARQMTLQRLELSVLAPQFAGPAFNDTFEHIKSFPLAGFNDLNFKGRWPNRSVPFVINRNLPNPERVIQAIAHWEENTALRFVKMQPLVHRQYIRFQKSDLPDFCSSSVGAQANGQAITLSVSCTRGNIIHEIGHAAGLWHEQSRYDRDTYVIVHEDNIRKVDFVNFEIPPRGVGLASGVFPYDYDSIMHYGPDQFAVDRTRPSIEPRNSSKHIGQRDGLSPGDMAAVAWMYR